MLVTHDGVLLHVDYGFILGELGREMHHYITFIGLQSGEMCT